MSTVNSNMQSVGWNFIKLIKGVTLHITRPDLEKT